jgi:cytochrome c-type biogenesis protein CcmH
VNETKMMMVQEHSCQRVSERGLNRFRPGTSFLPSFTLIFLAVLLWRFTSSASAQAPTPVVSDDAVNAIARELYCPVCENIPLDVCPTQACTQWRDLIREKLALGWDEGQIKDYFAQQYGDRVLAAPPRRGLNWLVYVLPPLTLLAGGVILFLALRPRRRASHISTTTEMAPASHTTPGQEAKPAQPSKPREPQGSNHHATDEYLRRIEEELRRREQ